MDRNSIKEAKSFTGDDGVDGFGHGTHVAGLVLRTAPDADLYIAKVSRGKNFTDTRAIAKVSDFIMLKYILSHSSLADYRVWLQDLTTFTENAKGRFRSRVSEYKDQTKLCQGSRNAEGVAG